MTMWDVAKEVAKNPIGKKVLIITAIASVAALIIPKIFGAYKFIVMIGELICCIVISVNVQRFSQMLVAAEQFFDEQNKMKK